MLFFKDIYKLCASMLLLLTPALTMAQSDVPDYGYNFHEENNITPDIETLTTDLFGDKIDIGSGSIRFEQTDISIPGNSELQVAITRTLSDPDSWFRETREFENWSLSIPHVRSAYIADRSGNYKSAYWPNGKACTKRLNSNPYFTTSGEGGSYQTNKHAYWNGDTVFIPGEGSVKLTEKSEDSTYKRHNNRNWKVECITTTEGYDGFKITVTNGVKYFFTQQRIVLSNKPFNLSPSLTLQQCGSGLFENEVVCQPETIGPSSGSTAISEYQQYYIFMLATRVEDRFGNWVSYEYNNNGQPVKITSNDNRTININYDGQRINTISALNKTWRYLYHVGGVRTLSAVIRPDNKQWKFDHDKTSTFSFWRSYENIANHTQFPVHGFECASVGSRSLITITHPEGLVGDFTLDEVCHGQSNVVKLRKPNPQRRSEDSYWIPREVSLFSIAEKRLTFKNGEQYKWTYRYSDNDGLFSDDTIRDQHRLTLDVDGVETAHLKSTTVINPDGTKTISYFDRRLGLTNGNLMYHEIYNTSDVFLQRDVYEYIDGENHGSPRTFSYIQLSLDPFTREDTATGHQASRKQLVAKQITTLFADSGNKSDVYTRNYGNYDIYDLPGTLSETNSFNTKKRFTQYEYYHDLLNGLIGLPSSTSISSNGNNFTEVMRTRYHSASSAYKSLPYEQQEFGRWYKRFDSYHTSGTQAGLAKRVSYNAVNRWVEFSDYKRGIAQTITLPQSVGNNTQQAFINVDDNGWVTNKTDFNGDCNNYRYNAIGRLTLIAPCDNRWARTSIAYSTVIGNEGLSFVSTGMIKQTISRGNYQKIIYHDNLLRPVLAKEWDITIPSTARFTRQSFDFKNRTVFQSVPSASSSTIDGVSTSYDALGRTKVVNDTMSSGDITYTYLNNNRIEIKDKKGHKTTTTYLAYGSPEQKNATLIQSPEGVNTSLQYSIYDKPTLITQGTISEHRIYDTYQQVCKILRPDTGNKAFGYNALGQILWQARGNSVDGSLTSCDTTVDSTEKITSSYDNQGMLKTVAYGDNTATKHFSYDKNGRLLSLIAGPTATRLTYNSANLVESESLSIDGKTFTLDPSYNSLGDMTGLIYPSGRQISYQVNALSQTTSIGPYVTNASYHPVGIVNTITYGNGITYTTGLNLRQLPDELLISKSGSSLLSQTVNYDANTNIDRIADNLDEQYTINMNYDGLDRIVTASGFWGQGSFSYDVLGNIRSKSLGEQQLSYTYDANNLLANVSGSKNYSFQYDNRGNVINNGHRQFSYNLANHVSASNSIHYIYDGNDRRAAKTKDGKTEYSFYGLGGTLLYRQKANGDHVDYLYLNKRLVSTLESL